MPKLSVYQEIITDLLEEMEIKGVDPRHVEAWMRIEHPTLDALVNWQWKSEVTIAVGCIEADGVESSERLAQSFGLFKAVA